MHRAWPAIALLFFGCTPTADENRTAETIAPTAVDSAESTAVELLLNWFPEAEHGGYFAALVHGFYRDEGLTVRIRPGGPGVPVLTQVASRRVMFGVANADQVLLGWAQDARTVAVMAPLQTSPRCIMVHAQSGIRDFASLQDVTLAMNPSSTFSLYLQQKVPLRGVQVVPYSGNVSQFLLDDHFAQQAYVFSEPFVVRQRGGNPHCLLVSDLGFNPYTSVLITHADTVREQPDLVRRMVTASVRGWRKYLEDPAETNRCLIWDNPEMSLDVLAYGAEHLRGLCVTDDVPLARLGTMTRARWHTLAEQLIEVQALAPDAVDPEQAYSTRFVEQAVR